MSNYLGAFQSAVGHFGEGVDAYNEKNLKDKKFAPDQAVIDKKNKDDEEKKAKTQAFIDEVRKFQAEQSAETSGYNAAVTAKPQIDAAGSVASQGALDSQYNSGKTMDTMDRRKVFDEANAKYPSLGPLPGRAALDNIAKLRSGTGNMKSVNDLSANGYTQPPKPASTPESIQAGQDAMGTMKRDIQNKAAANPDYGKLSLQAASRLTPLAVDAGLKESDVPLLGTLKDQSAQQERGKERQIMADATMSNNAATNEQREADRKQRGEDNQANREMRAQLAEIMGSNKNITMDIAKDKWTESQWQSFDKRTNALNTTSRSALGQSGIANIRAARAVDVLTNTKDITSDPYVYSLVNTDLQGIMKGGVPNEVQLREKYTNLQSSLADIWQKVTANPVAVNQPAVKQQLLGIIQSIRQIDNNVIDKNLGVAKVAFKKIIQEDPDRAEEFFKALSQSKEVFPQNENTPATPGQSSQPSAAPSTTIKSKSGHVYSF